MLVFACLAPHAPLFLPEVGSKTDRQKVKKTIEALESLAPKLKKAKPDIIIISSPHEDWGFKVPLFFLRKNINDLRFKMYDLREPNEFLNVLDSSFLIHNSYIIYPLLTTLDTPKQHYEWGQQIASALPAKLRVAWIASGDMSHRLKEDGPYGFKPEGPKYDQEFMKLLKKKNIQDILDLDPNLTELAAECGLRSFCLLLGTLEWQSRLAGQKPRLAWQPQILSYEGPFGVGYLVANLKIT